MDYLQITQQYYSKWLGQDQIISKTQNGLCFFYSEERNKVQHGYDKQYDIWCLHKDDQILISFGKGAEDRIDDLKNALHENISVDELCEAITKIYQKPPSVGVKYVFSGRRPSYSQAVALSQNDFNRYLDFFMRINPSCTDTSWIKEYFTEMINAKMCCGIIINNELVSCTDAPGMPFLGEKIQEIGINTRTEYRGRGLAFDACALCIQNILTAAKCPLWSTDIANIGSQKLAEKLGFVAYGRSIALAL